MKTANCLKILLALSIGGMAGCASKRASDLLEERVSTARPKPAAFAADGFYRDGEFTERNLPRPGEFFYKHCSIVGHQPYPIASEWDCPDPQ